MARTALVAPAIAAVALVAGCGGNGGSGGRDDEAAGSPGAKIFAEGGCGDCHTMATAGSSGTVGPNLDELRPNEERVVRQVTNGGNGMPPFKEKLTAKEIQEVAAFVAISSGTGKAGTISFKPDDTTVSACTKAACFEQAFGNLAYEEGPGTALDKLAEMSSTNRTIQGNCHPIAHKIGAGGLLYFEGSVGRAFAAGNATCGAGYFHGLLQWKLAGVRAEEVADVAASACQDSEIAANAFNYYQCNHGLGHGLMLYSGLDLPKALDYCHQLRTRADSTMCSGGVFMENQSSSFGLRSKWLSTKDLLYPCNSRYVQREDKYYCYLLVTSHILRYVDVSWKKTADWCRRSEPGWAKYCFQSYGRDVASAAVRDPHQMKTLCGHAGSGEKECIYGAIRDVMNNNSQDPRGKDFCEIVETASRAYCFFGMGTILGTQHADQEGKRAACEQWARADDLSQCFAGADVGSPR